MVLKPKRVTLKDIARVVNVSDTVVSCAINDRPNGSGNVSIRPELRTRIKEVARQMGYRPNRSARTLRTGRSKTIGVLTTQSYYEINNAKTYSVCQEISRRGYNYIIHQIDFDSSAESYTKAVHLLEDCGVDGCIIINLASDSITEAEADIFRGMACPVVDASGALLGTRPSVSADSYGAFREMAAHVIARGARNLAIVIPGYARSKYSPRRVQGMADACEGVKGAKYDLFNYPKEMPMGHEVSLGFEATLSLLEEARPDAILYSNDTLALGGLKALSDRGIGVPKDMLVCGFDGIEMTGFSSPPLTTAVQPIREIAGKLVEFLFAAIEGKDDIPANSVCRMPCQVVLRESTGD